MVRRAKSKVQPVYPELARKMNITGTVKVEVVVAPERHGEGCEGGGRSSSTGRCSAGSGQEVAL